MVEKELANKTEEFADFVLETISSNTPIEGGALFSFQYEIPQNALQFLRDLEG
jgi:hypothetical protein